jgi:hypothetical protein
MRNHEERRSILIKEFLALLFLIALPVLSQVNDRGELRLQVSDPSGQPVKTTVQVKSAGNGYDNLYATDDRGIIAVNDIPYGVYLVQVEQQGFTAISKPVEVRSAIPVEYDIRLELAPVATVVNVQDSDTLIDPQRSSSTMQIGSKEIENRVSSLPGRSIQDLVNSQPGWLYMGNAVLHPRGSEYQTQFVIDGIPLIDNRSPSFGPEIEVDGVDSMSIYTAGFPAEYGRKMGGVIEINTKREIKSGVHGQLVLSGGSYDAASSFGYLQK